MTEEEAKNLIDYAINKFMWSGVKITLLIIPVTLVVVGLMALLVPFIEKAVE